MKPIFKKSGFTLIELLVVSTIIIILTTIGLVSYQKAMQNSRNAKRKADMETVRQALVLYRADFGNYPAGNYSAMTNTLTNPSNRYLSSPPPSDPKDSAPYTYSYSSGGATFTLTARLEPSATVYTVTSP